MKTILTWIAGVASVAGFIPYIREILRGKTKPVKATWIIWTTLDSITLAGMFVKHSLNGQIVGAVIGCWIIAALSLRYGKPGWTLFDKICLGGALLSVVLWAATGDAKLGILISMTGVFIGSLPTFAETWIDPTKEDKLSWAIFFVACLCTVAVIPKWTIEDAAQPVSFFLVNAIMMLIFGLARSPRFREEAREKTSVFRGCPPRSR